MAAEGLITVAPWPLRVCLHDDAVLIWLHAAGDAIAAGVYIALAAGLWYFAHKRREIPFQGLVVWFGLYFALAALARVLTIQELWWTRYGITGTVKALQAVAGLCAGIRFLSVMPDLLRLPSASEVERMRIYLDQQKHRLAENLAAELMQTIEALQAIAKRS